MLCIENLSYKNILHNISVEFNEGEICVILGDTGSGKTILLKIIAGLLNKSKGEILFDNEPLSRKSGYHKKIGAMIEQPDFYESASGIYNLNYLSDINDNRNDEYIEDLLVRFDLFDEKDKLVKNYSLGMKKKLGIIQAVMENQKIILFDEPTNGLDDNSKNIFIKLVMELRAKGKILIISSNINSDEKKLADRLFILDKGILKESSIND